MPGSYGSAGGEGGDDLVERDVGQGPHLVVGAVLDRVGHEDARRVEPERLRLGRGGVDELARRDEHAGYAPALQISDVGHTARRARPSVGERLDDQVALRGKSQERRSGKEGVSPGKYWGSP